MSNAGFVHLHTHSEYSDFDGLSSVRRLVDAASADDQGAVAITDHGRLASLAALRTACEKVGDVKPIPGIEAYIVVAGTRHEPGTIEVAADSDDLDAEGSASHGTQARTKTKKYEHLTILARTRQGLVNLIEMSNVSQETKSGTHPLIDYELLARYGEGLIVLTGCIGGPVAGPLSRITGEDPEADAAERARAQSNLEALINAVGRENVYVELADHGQAAQERALAGLYGLAERDDLPVVVANDSHYVAEDEQTVHEAHMALGQKRTVTSENRYRFAGEGQFFRTGAQMRALRPDDPRWQAGCDETVAIAERIEDDLFPEPRLRVPSFPIPAEYRRRYEAGDVKHYPVPSVAAEGTRALTFSYFMHRVHAGATDRWGEDLPDEHAARIKFELSVICRLGVMDYFLLVADLIAWARSDWTAEDWVACHDTGEVPEETEHKQPINVGPGRGSAPGSAISYALQIVGVDPIEGGLLFERFLDLERTEMPDIDVDFERERRDEVIEYLSVRYGHDNVCRLGMHGTNQTKRALDSAGRYLEIPVTAVAEVKKALPADSENLSLLLDPDAPDTSSMSSKDAAAALERHASGQALRDHLDAADEQVREMARNAAVLEGVVVSPGKHACGIVVADENLMPLVPMRLDKGEWVTEWDGPAIADFGLLKMDVLGLRNLDIAHAAHDNAAEHDEGDGIDFDLTTLRLDGPRAEATWELLGRGDSTGVFQLESEGMRELLTTARPRTLDDLAALIAAYRPGPMSAGMHTDWAQRAGGHEPVSYAAITSDPGEQEVIASVLDQSQGVILFQEQMMRLGKIVGKFDAARANNLRRAISKKKQDLIDSLRADFIAGAQREGVGEDGVTPVPAFSKDTAQRLWTAFEGSGSYAFNRSHTTAYGVIAYQTAYLKANWPAEFGAAVLRFTGSGTDKAHLRVATIRSLRGEGIEVMAPDINTSDEHTVARSGKVWLGLSEIKGVGSIAAEIVAERTSSGAYSSMADVATRVVVPATAEGGKRKSVTSAQLLALAQAGAFDSFGGGFRLGHVIASRAVAKDPDVRVPDMEYSVLEKAARQRGAILAVTGTHPTKALSRQIAALYQRGPDDDAATKPPRGLHNLPGEDGARVHTGGVVSAFTERLTRKGTWMVTLELENSHTSIGCVGFADVHADLKEIGMPEPGDLVEIHGRVRLREVEREVVDETTGETSTQTSVEHSIFLTGLEYMDVEDPDRDAEGDPELAVGRMLADGIAAPTSPPSRPGQADTPATDTDGIAAPASPPSRPGQTGTPATDSDGIADPGPAGPPLAADSGSDRNGDLGEDEEEFEPITSPPGGTAPASSVRPHAVAAPERGRATAAAHAPSPRRDRDDGADLAEMASSTPWTRLREVLSRATGETFELASPRRETLGTGGVGEFMRLETAHGGKKTPPGLRDRLADLAAAGRLPVIISTARLRCVVIDPRTGHDQLKAMTDAIHSGAIDPATTSIDAPAASPARAS